MEHGALVTPDGNVIKWQDVPQPQTPNTLPNEITQLCTKVTLTRQPLAIGQAKGAETICGVGFNFCRPYNEPVEAGPFRIIGFLPEGVAGKSGLIKVMDYLHAVDNQIVYSLSTDEVVLLIKGLPNTDVTLWLTSSNDAEAIQNASRQALEESKSPSMGFLMSSPSVPGIEEEQDGRSSFFSSFGKRNSKKRDSLSDSDFCHHHRLRRVCKECAVGIRMP